MSLWLASNMRALRVAAGFSQEQVADRAGVSQTWISRMERGEGNPTLDTLISLANAFEILLVDLLDENGWLADRI